MRQTSYSRGEVMRRVTGVALALAVVVAPAGAQITSGGKGGGLPGGPGGGPGSGGGSSMPDDALLYHVLDRITYGATDEHVAMARSVARRPRSAIRSGTGIHCTPITSCDRSTARASSTRS